MAFFRKGEPKEDLEELELLRQQIDRANLPEHVETVALKELEKLEKTPTSAAEYVIGVNYLEYLATLPWNIHTEDNLDLDRAERILNNEHAGLEQIKERILEYLAVRALKIQRTFRLLVVDDEEIARTNLEHILKGEGYQVATATNGAEALERMASEAFDLVLTDLLMMKVGGMELLQKIKNEHPQTDVIIVTGYATVPSAVEALQKGAYHYLAKPLKIEQVRATVREALSRKQWAHKPKGPVLCFMGPPGTGKTSLGRSIAAALGRKFIRLSVAGMKDEAEIRGHRRSYAGAMPGRIIEAIRRIGSNNPVFMLDEIDKIGQDFRGDPASALLEVLDPEQNDHFVDYYLDVPFDLSSVMFIGTANLLEPIPRPLLDRMEVLSLPGYTDEEKETIAYNFLIPRQLEAAGLESSAVQFSPEAVLKIIREYTREAGLRNLEREIGSVCRKIARQALRKGASMQSVTVTPAKVEQYLGPRKFFYEVAEARDRVGVTTGLVWTETGGDIIFVEATRMKGTKGLILTGSLGEVMQESAQAALSYVRSNAAAFGIVENFFDDHDIHIHVPAGAIPKDGPSAGLTIALALISLLTGRPARRQVAMSGELTLSGRVLPVAGIRAKILAARRAGVETVVFPEKNRAELDDLASHIRGDLQVICIASVDEVVEVVLR
ncbi:MAG: endopeptidase La [Deltaproteobacteria bacterium]|nr:endopeptidase La [Deltaproteobacteria bacterium]MBW2070957.1 endopeptidase La [Deltaproteobacteria bacterium]